MNKEEIQILFDFLSGKEFDGKSLENIKMKLSLIVQLNNLTDEYNDNFSKLQNELSLIGKEDSNESKNS